MFDFVTFHNSSTRSGSLNKLVVHNFAPTSYFRHFYFNRISRLWNSLPYIDLNLPFSVIKANVYDYISGTTLFIILILLMYTCITLFVLATNVLTSDIRLYLTNEHYALMYIIWYPADLADLAGCPYSY